MTNIKQLFRKLYARYLDQHELIVRIRKDLLGIKAMLEDPQSNALLKRHYLNDMRKLDRKLRKLERRTYVLMNRLIRLTGEPKGQHQEVLKRKFDGFMALVEKEGQLHTAIKDANVEIIQETLDRLLNSGGLIDEIVAILTQIEHEVEGLEKLPYQKEDNIPEDEYYGEHLFVENGKYYHADVYSSKNRFEKELEGITFPSFRFWQRPLIVDAGCSVGYTTHSLKKRYKRARVVGLDLNDRSLRKARRFFPTIIFKKADFYNLSTTFSPSSITMVFMGNNFSLASDYIYDLNKILKDVKKVLVDGGWWYIYDSHKVLVVRKIAGQWKYIQGKKTGEFSPELLEQLNVDV